MVMATAWAGPTQRARLIGLAVGLLTLLFAQWLIHLESARVQQAAQLRLQGEAALVRASLESELNSTLSIGLSVAAFIAANPDFRNDEYERLAETLFVLQPRLRNLALAPDNIISHVHPLPPNAPALGAALETLPEQREAVLRLRAELKPLTAGPLNLVQGGIGLVSRVPVQVPGDDGLLRYWGHVAVVVDPLPIFMQAGLGGQGEVAYALRGRDGKGQAGEVFLGAPALFADPRALRMAIRIPGGEWELAAVWRDAVAATGWQPLPWQLLAFLLAAAAGGLAGYALQSQQRLEVLASHDSLTGLANRHRFLTQAEAFVPLAERQRRPFTLLNLDLESFKAINDQYGHEVGDAMLVHVAGQARGCLRASDLIARFGGDEFLVLLPDTEPGPELDVLLGRLREAIALPLVAGERTLRVGISVGIAAFPRDGRTLAELMRVADADMYANKRRRGTVGLR